MSDLLKKDYVSAAARPFYTDFMDHEFDYNDFNVSRRKNMQVVEIEKGTPDVREAFLPIFLTYVEA